MPRRRFLHAAGLALTIALIAVQAALACSVMVFVRYEVECSNGASATFQAALFEGEPWQSTMRDALSAFDTECSEDLSPLVPLLTPDNEVEARPGTFHVVPRGAEAVDLATKRSNSNFLNCDVPTVRSVGEWALVGTSTRPYCPWLRWPDASMCFPPSIFSLLGFLGFALGTPAAWPTAAVIVLIFVGVVAGLALLLRGRRWLPRRALLGEIVILGAAALFLMASATYLPLQLVGWALAAYLLARVVSIAWPTRAAA